MVMLDANMILRYLLNDNAEMAEKAEEYINAKTAVVTIEVVAEVIYVLKGVYDLDRDETVSTIKKLLPLVSCQENDVVSLALDTYGERNLDFIDCVLFAYNRVKGFEIATFDKKLLKLLGEQSVQSIG